LEGGEDPRFIARRLVILASEDIGLADSRGLQIATATLQAVDFVGMPEAALSLSHCTLFLALCPKSNSATEALARARQAIKKGPIQPVPLWLRDGHNKVGKQLGHGADYQYSHDHPDAISGQDYLETPLELYLPKDQGAEAALAERLAAWKRLKAQRKAGQSGD
ncbi:MAG: replication-associated recombination protein A, partial [Verrucomicrobiota bacterium]